MVDFINNPQAFPSFAWRYRCSGNGIIDSEPHNSLQTSCHLTLAHQQLSCIAYQSRQASQSFWWMSSFPKTNQRVQGISSWLVDRIRSFLGGREVGESLGPKHLHVFETRCILMESDDINSLVLDIVLPLGLCPPTCYAFSGQSRQKGVGIIWGSKRPCCTLYGS